LANDSKDLLTADWRRELPRLSTRLVVLREAGLDDFGPLVDLLSLADASRFGIDDGSLDEGVQTFLERVQGERVAGVSFAFVVTLATTHAIVGLIQVRRLDPTFEAAEWEMTLAPSARGTGVFVDAARLVGSFAFDSVGVHRLESRVTVQNGRANGALRKLGAVQEGVLRRAVRRGDDYHDQVLWSVLKEDWGHLWVSTAVRVH
jgi:RimJ/RimL family protein N-acetyltransferase